MLTLVLGLLGAVIVAWVLGHKARKSNTQIWKAFISAEQNEGQLRQMRMTDDGELHTDVTLEAPIATASAGVHEPGIDVACNGPQ